MASYSKNFLNAMDGHTGLYDSGTDPGGKVPTPEEAMATHRKYNNPELTGFDMVNELIAEGVDPAKAGLDSETGKKVSFYPHLESKLGQADARLLYTAIQMFNNRPEYKSLGKEARLERFYDTISNNPRLQTIKEKIRNYTGENSPTALYRTSQFRLNKKDGNNVPQQTAGVPSDISEVIDSSKTKKM